MILRLSRERAEQLGIPGGQVVSIIDMDGFNIKQYAYRPAGELVVALVRMYEANYPEILKNCYIINGTFFSIKKNFFLTSFIKLSHCYFKYSSLALHFPYLVCEE